MAVIIEVSLEQVTHLFDLIVSEGNEDVSGEANKAETGIDADDAGASSTVLALRGAPAVRNLQRDL